MLDRLIQQSIVQVLTPVFDPNFSASSHGFRPKRSAHGATKQVRRTIRIGYRHCVDMDRSQFFDRVRWNQCQEVIDRSMSVINLHGLDAKTKELVEQSLNEHNPNWQNEDCSATRIAVQLIDWIKQSSGKLKAAERAWLLTEILESLFGKYKQLERQHSKGGFTRLIAAIPTLCIQATREIVRQAFRAVDTKRKACGICSHCTLKDLSQSGFGNFDF